MFISIGYPRTPANSRSTSGALDGRSQSPERDPVRFELSSPQDTALMRRKRRNQANQSNQSPPPPEKGDGFDE
jgi:hypothetical protein